MNDVNMITGDAFRQVLSHLPTGVTVVTAYTPEGRTGMAANSVASVSLSPAMILLCPSKTSTTWPLIREAGHFCVNVMAGHHEAATRAFSRKGVDRFEGMAVTERAAGPGLADAVAWLECKMEAEHDAGDHTIVVARVFAIEAASDRSPLVFFQGRYGTFLGS